MLLFMGYLLLTNHEEKEQFLIEDNASPIESMTNLTVLESESNSEVTIGLLYVDVKGEVSHPGVYQLEHGARLNDAIQMAGGFTNEADETQLNLALLLTDQMMVIVPNRLAEDSANVNNQYFNFIETVAEKNNVESIENTKININSADSQELSTLPGIGEKKAQAIIQYREENGSFHTTEEIKNVSGIGEKTFAQIAELIKVE